MRLVSNHDELIEHARYQLIDNYFYRWQWFKIGTVGYFFYILYDISFSFSILDLLLFLISNLHDP